MGKKNMRKTKPDIRKPSSFTNAERTKNKSGKMVGLSDISDEEATAKAPGKKQLKKSSAKKHIHSDSDNSDVVNDKTLTIEEEHAKKKKKSKKEKKKKSKKKAKKSKHRRHNTSSSESEEEERKKKRKKKHKKHHDESDVSETPAL